MTFRRVIANAVDELGGVSRVAAKAGLTRQGLFKILECQSDPRPATIDQLLKACTALSHEQQVRAAEVQSQILAYATRS